MKRKLIGGSDIAALFNLQPWGCKRRLYYERKDIPCDYEEIETYHMKRGKLLEPLAKYIYSDTTGRKLSDVSAIERYPFCIHPDAAIENGGMLEIKCPSEFSFKEIRRAGISDGYILQLHIYSYLSEADFSEFFIFSAELADWLIVNQPINMKIVDSVIQEADRFMSDLENNIIPERLHLPDSRCADCSWRQTCQGSFLSQFTGVKKGENIVNDPDMAYLAHKYREVKSDYDFVSTEMDEIKEEIKNYIDTKLKKEEMEKSVIETDGMRVYYNSQESNRFRTAEFKKEHSELYKKYCKKITTRPLRIFSIGG